MNLLKAFTDGELQTVILSHNERKSPGKNRAWLILGGHIHFVTGTHTSFEHQIRDTPGGPIERLWASGIDAAVANGELALFNNYPDARGSQFQIIIVKGVEELCFFGAATAYVVARVLEWKYQ